MGARPFAFDLLVGFWVWLCGSGPSMVGLLIDLWPLSRDYRLLWGDKCFVVKQRVPFGLVGLFIWFVFFVWLEYSSQGHLQGCQVSIQLTGFLG